MSVTQSAHERSSSTGLPAPVLSPELLVSLAATPWLLTIVAIRATSRLLEQVGLTSEEIFRGERLPVIHFPTDAT